MHLRDKHIIVAVVITMPLAFLSPPVLIILLDLRSTYVPGKVVVWEHDIMRRMFWKKTRRSDWSFAKADSVCIVTE